MKMERINVLWTGGFDSSFVICQLSLLPVEIQPIYISMRRKSEPFELKAMQKIGEFINANSSKQCKLLPLRIVNEGDIQENRQITDSYNTIIKEHQIGYQQERLSRLSRQMGEKLVQGIEEGPGGTGNVSSALRNYATLVDGCIKLEGGEEIKFAELDPAGSTREIMDIFWGIRFIKPLWDMTKLQTREAYKDIGYEKVMPMTWFCAQPVNGSPCGLCNPCASVMKADMAFRLPLRAIIMFKLFKKNRVLNYFFVKLRMIHYRFR